MRRKDGTQLLWPKFINKRTGLVAVVLGLAAICIATLTKSADASDLVDAYGPFQIADSVASADGDYVYVVGYITHTPETTTSKTSGAWSSSSTAPTDLFVAKYNSSGGREITYVADIPAEMPDTGNGNDYGKAIALDTDGNVYVTGQAFSPSGTYSKFFVRKFDSNLSPSGNIFYYSHSNALDTGNDLCTSTESGTTYVYAAGTQVGGNGSKDIVTTKIHWTSGTPSADWTRIYGTSTTVDETAVKIAAQHETAGTVGVPGTPTTDTYVYVAGKKDNNVLALRYDSSGSNFDAGVWNYSSNTNEVTGLALTPEGSNRIYISTTSMNSATSQLNACLVAFSKSVLGAQGSGWTGSYYYDCDAASSSIGVVLDPTTSRPIVCGTVGLGGSIHTGAPVTYLTDVIAIPWSVDGLHAGTAYTFGDKYKKETAMSCAVNGAGEIYIVGSSRAFNANNPVGACSDNPCGNTTMCTMPTITASAAEEQAYVAAFTVSVDPITSIVSFNPQGTYTSSYPRIHGDGSAAATSTGVFASYDYVDSPSFTNEGYMAVYALH